MNLNDCFDLEITSLSSEGNGVGHKDGMAVFVNGAVVGDIVKIKITNKRKNFAEGKIIKLIKASEYRINPLCKVAAKCGGCSFQYIDYEYQAKWKQTQVIETLIRIGGFSRELISNSTKKILHTEKPFRYRNKIQMPIAGESSNPQIGFYESGSHEVVDSDECIIQHTFADKVREIFRQNIKKYKIMPYNEKTSKGLLKHIMVRIGTRTNQVMVVVVLAFKNLKFLEAIATQISNEAKMQDLELKAFLANINPGSGNIVLGEEFISIFGGEYIEEIMNNLKFRISPQAFFQVNTKMAEKMFDEVIKMANLNGNEFAVDLYCGTGSISLLLSKHCKEVMGIESVSKAIDDANFNAIANDTENIDFILGRSENVLPKLVNKGLKADLIVLDPPRKGAEPEVLGAIIDAMPSKIIYVSCNPSTLARDCKILCENGAYSVKSIQPVDMFPWTTHVETVVLMSRVEK